MIQDRPGALRDVEALGDLCQALGFETTLKMDPTAQVRGSPSYALKEGHPCQDPGDSHLGLSYQSWAGSAPHV